MCLLVRNPSASTEAGICSVSCSRIQLQMQMLPFGKAWILAPKLPKQTAQCLGVLPLLCLQVCALACHGSQAYFGTRTGNVTAKESSIFTCALMLRGVASSPAGGLLDVHEGAAGGGACRG